MLCRTCGKERELKKSDDYDIDNRRGKISSDTVCAECN
jgi:hypothetical protein